MKTNSPLLSKMTNPDTLRLAWRKIAAKGAAGGIDGQTVADFSQYADKYLDQLRWDLLERRYEPEPTQTLSIPKGPDKTGYRELALSTVRDKIVQETMRSVLEPIMERLFRNCSYGYRLGKGPHKAIKRADHIIRNLNRQWVVSADIDDFFGTIDHDKLTERLRPVLQDEEILRIMLLWLKMGAVDRAGRWRDIYSGVRQGNIISPLLANFYLTPFDQSMEDRGYDMVRYADDLRIFCAERREAEQALAEATDYLKSRLNLQFNQNLNPVTSVEEGFTFLGVFFQGASHLISPDKLTKITGKINDVSSGLNGNFAAALGHMNEAVQGWRRYYAQVVDESEWAKLENIQKNGLLRLLTGAFQKKQFKTLYEAEQAVQSVELIIQRNVKERGEFLKALAQEARLTAQNPLSPSKNNDVDRLVRKKKREWFQQATLVSEVIVNTPGCFIGKDSQRVVIRKDRKNIGEIPITRLNTVTVASHGVALSADVIVHCASHDIPLLFLGPRGEVNAMLMAPSSFSAAIGLLQLQAVNYAPTGLNLARRFVEGKIKNQMNLIKYLNKYRKNVDGDFAQAATENLAQMEGIAAEAKRIATDAYERGRGQLFSIEGRAASCYWQTIKILLKERTDFPGRERHHAKDIVNSLLNYGYAILTGRVHLAIIKHGLFPNISFLHSLAKDKPTLVFDMMEEFRPQVVDRTVWTLLGRRENLAVNKEGLLTDETRKFLLAALHHRLASLVRFRGKELKLEEIINHQAKALVQHLEGKAPYRPFLGKW